MKLRIESLKTVYDEINVTLNKQYNSEKENWAKSIKHEKYKFFWRVWSWLRINAGGMPNTCKSNGLAC